MHQMTEREAASTKEWLQRLSRQQNPQEYAGTLKSETKLEAEKLRKEYRAYRDEVTNNDNYTTTAKAQMIKNAREKLELDLHQLRKDYAAEKAARTEELSQAAFARSGSESDYMRAMTEAGALDGKQRINYVNNAIDAGAHDAVRAVGRLAYRENDMGTLAHIRSAGHPDTAAAVGELMKHLRDTNTVQAKFADSAAFTMPAE